MSDIQLHKDTAERINRIEDLVTALDRCKCSGEYPDQFRDLLAWIRNAQIRQSDTAAIANMIAHDLPILFGDRDGLPRSAGSADL
jgi:hypothetical protein